MLYYLGRTNIYEGRYFGTWGLVFINLRFDMIHVNTASVTELYHYGTVCQEKVVSSSTVKSFKVRLDRFWANEEIYYNYKTNISCTGSQSNYDVELE